MMLNYSPQSCDPELLQQCTVGACRLRLLETLIEAVRHEVGKPTHQHQIVIGPRGSGKTHLLSLLVARFKADESFRAKVLPVQMPEEVTAGQPADLVGQIIGRLADTLDHEPALLGADAAATVVLCHTRLDGIRALHDDREALVLAFDSLDEIAAKAGRLIVAVVENFDSLLYSGASRGRTSRETPQWAFRKELQSRGGVLLIAASPTSFGEIHDVAAPFHDFFREHELDELSLDEMVAMMRARLEVELTDPHLDDRTRRRLLSLKADFSRREPALRGVLTLAGGLPRFGHLLFDVIVETEMGSSLQVLSRFLDEQTPYFQSFLNPRLIPERELAVLDFLAMSEGPRTPTQISRDLRGFPINAVAMCLKRLLERRLVRRRAEGPKEVRYDVAEPLLRVWRRFRTGRGEQDRLLLLAEFVAALFEQAELMAERHLLAQTAPECPRLRLLDFALQHQVAAKSVVEPQPEVVGTSEGELNAAAEAEFLHGNLQKARQMMEKVVIATERRGDEKRLVLALSRLSHMALLSGDNAEALRAATRGEELAVSAKHDLGRANCIQSRGDVLFRLGENAAARQAYDDAEALYQKVGDDLGRANCMSDRGRALARMGEWAQGLGEVLQAMTLARRVDARVNVPLILNDYLNILKDDTPVADLSRLNEHLGAVTGLATELATTEGVRSAFSRLAVSVVRRLPGEASVGAIRAMVAQLPDSHAELLKPALLAAQVRAGTLSEALPAEPEEVRRAVRLVLGSLRTHSCQH